MSNNIDAQVAILGAGAMGIAYAKVLQSLGVSFAAIGRSEESCSRFAEATGVQARPGSVDAFVSEGGPLPRTAIVAVSIQELAPVCVMLLRNGVRRILLEKPGGNDLREIGTIVDAAKSSGAEVLLAYNRRFYASTQRAREIIREDGGLTSFTFEFTEWSDDVEKSHWPPRVKQNWFLASSHVCDLAFFLGGRPVRLCAETAGSLAWHPSGAIFAGAGVTASGALFSYHANWDSAGRWGIELSTKAHRLILRPMEQLFVSNRGTVSIQEVDLKDDLDKSYKPGLYRQVRSFLANDTVDLLSVSDHFRMVQTVYARICPNPAYSTEGDT